ncbi:hypothetical protein [Lactiplantibacillus plantarum]|uniref:hypothetical protein n=1 Tax=Lactiplantibacillus plantarum TaxID=1590 RepID=UPI0009312E33|nr:hypothetical protein [Lactiplantibacillus plantarum]
MDKPILAEIWGGFQALIWRESLLKGAYFESSKIASLGPLEKVRISVNMLGWFVLHRLPGISVNCRNVVGTDLSRKITSQILAFQ